MVIYNVRMTITVTAFKAKCLELLRQSEGRAEPIEITRHGKVIARVVPAGVERAARARPWERLRGSGVLKAGAEDSVLSDVDFDALR